MKHAPSCVPLQTGPGAAEAQGSTPPPNCPESCPGSVLWMAQDHITVTTPVHPTQQGLSQTGAQPWRRAALPPTGPSEPHPSSEHALGGKDHHTSTSREALGDKLRGQRPVPSTGAVCRIRGPPLTPTPCAHPFPRDTVGAPSLIPLRCHSWRAQGSCQPPTNYPSPYPSPGPEVPPPGPCHSPCPAP